MMTDSERIDALEREVEALKERVEDLPWNRDLTIRKGDSSAEQIRTTYNRIGNDIYYHGGTGRMSQAANWEQQHQPRSLWPYSYEEWPRQSYDAETSMVNYFQPADHQPGFGSDHLPKSDLLTSLTRYRSARTPGMSSNVPHHSALSQRRDSHNFSILPADKVYCDHWIHHGTCGFTQLGCKYKHEMPSDPEILARLGLRDGWPAWYKRNRGLELAASTQQQQQEMKVEVDQDEARRLAKRDGIHGITGHWMGRQC